MRAALQQHGHSVAPSAPRLGVPPGWGGAPRLGATRAGGASRGAAPTGEGAAPRRGWVAAWGAHPSCPALAPLQPPWLLGQQPRPARRTQGSGKRWSQALLCSHPAAGPLAATAPPLGVASKQGPKPGARLQALGFALRSPPPRQRRQQLMRGAERPHRQSPSASRGWASSHSSQQSAASVPVAWALCVTFVESAAKEACSEHVQFVAAIIKSATRAPVCPVEQSTHTSTSILVSRVTCSTQSAQQHVLLTTKTQHTMQPGTCSEREREETHVIRHGIKGD